MSTAGAESAGSAKTSAADGAAVKTGSQTESKLFDLLKVGAENRKLYIIHVKKDFAAKMRDACSQITTSADVIWKDCRNGKTVLANYYRDEWSKDELNAGIGEELFLSWFDYDLVYVVLCATSRDFVAEDFERGRLTSHIARREILAAKNEMKRNRFDFRLLTRSIPERKRPNGPSGDRLFVSKNRLLDTPDCPWRCTVAALPDRSVMVFTQRSPMAQIRANR